MEKKTTASSRTNSGPSVALRVQEVVDPAAERLVARLADAPGRAGALGRRLSLVGTI